MKDNTQVGASALCGNSNKKHFVTLASCSKKRMRMVKSGLTGK